MEDDRRNVVIVGASAAGLRCACRLARLRPDWSVRVVEAQDIFSYAACGLPYVLSGDISDARDLRTTDYGVVRDADYFSACKGVEVLAGQRATDVDVQGRSLTLSGPDGARTLEWDELVLATGAGPRRLEGQPDHPRVVTFHVWDDVEPLKQSLARGEIDRVALVGAGLVGCELAEAFTSLWGAQVTLIERAQALLPEALDADVAACVAGHMRANGVKLLLGAPVDRIETYDDEVKLIAGETAVTAQAAVVAIGVRPAVGLAARAGAEIGPRGAIAVDERLATSVPHIWAVGDCIEVRHAVTGEPAHVPLGSLANRQGRTLANILAGRPDAFPPVTGATALKVFDWNVASVGCTAAVALERGFSVRSVWISAQDRAHYWPEVLEIHLKLVYDPSSRRVLGVQAVGPGEVAKRIDVASQLIARRATLEELAHIEQAYAPPYAPAMEPLAVLAQAAQNQEDGVVAMSPGENCDGLRVLDVRQPEEVEARPACAGNVRAIRLGELQQRLEEVEGSTELVVCERGTRSAEAVRLLRRRGVASRYLGGGQSWRLAMGTGDEPPEEGS